MFRYVEKLRVPVRIALQGVAPTEGLLSLSPRAEQHEGPETILDRLNGPQRVLPFHRREDGAVVLVTRLHVVWVEAGPMVAAAVIRPPAYMTTREEHVRVRLIGEEAIEGVLAMEMPTEYNRASDYLNGPEDFFPLVTSTGTRLINKAMLLDVQVFASAAIPKAA